MRKFQLFINQDDRRISLILGLALIAIALLSAFSVWHVMRSDMESTLTKSLSVTLENKVRLIETQIKHGLADTKSAGTRLFLIQSLEQIKSSRSKDAGIAGVIKTADRLLELNFSKIVISDYAGEEVISTDINSTDPTLIVKLETDPDIDSFLFWDGQFKLRNVMDVLDHEYLPVGRITTEQALPDLTKIFTDVNLIGETGDFLLCAAVKDSNLEMDCFLRGFDGNQFKRLLHVVSNKPLPMHYALSGLTGIKSINDYRQIPVVAAHIPVMYGLGAVIKIDKEELHHLVTKQSNTILLYLGLIVLVGMAILHRLILPLIYQSMLSRKKLLKSNTRLEQAKINAEKISIELTAYINAVGKLALISISDRKGRILQANEKFCEISGYTQEELLGQDHRILNSGQHPKSFFVDMWATIASGKIWHQEICNRNKQGSFYWVDSTIVPLTDLNGKIDRYLSVRVDITARKKKDLALNERLKESNCLHDIRYYLELNLDSEEICRKVLNRLVQAMQFPKVSAACIRLNNTLIQTENYQEDLLQQELHARIVINGKISGQLQVIYTENFPFLLPEEQSLVDTIAHDLGRWLERKEAEKRILAMATHDALTGLPNRRLLQDRLEQVIAHDSRSHTQMAVLFVDLDHFKIINDTMGHDVGDLLLKSVSERLITCVRNEDTVARQGGDEFIIVLHSIAESLHAGIVAQKIIDTLTQPFQIHQKKLHIGASIGIAVFPDNGSDAETLLKHSDIAMYHAKKSGRNNYQFFSEELNQSAHEKHNLSLDLRLALERNQFILHFQPVIDMPDYTLHSIEVLLRWQHPEHKLIPPQKFITIAEETGLIIPISQWVLRTICEQIKTWLDQGYDVPRLAVNISARQFQADDFVENVTHILNETGVDARYFTFEITESMLISNIDRVVNILNRINAMGIHISVDDFGTGYSSLSYLKRFPIDTLKIDRSFTRDITIDPSDLAITEAIIAMAKSLDIDIIAEGIETEDQLNLLMQQGCCYHQGFYFSRAIPANEIIKQLKKRSAQVIPGKRKISLSK